MRNNQPRSSSTSPTSFAAAFAATQLMSIDVDAEETLMEDIDFDGAFAGDDDEIAAALGTAQTQQGVAMQSKSGSASNAAACPNILDIAAPLFPKSHSLAAPPPKSTAAGLQDHDEVATLPKMAKAKHPKGKAAKANAVAVSVAEGKAMRRPKLHSLASPPPKSTAAGLLVDDAIPPDAAGDVDEVAALPKGKAAKAAKAAKASAVAVSVAEATHVPKTLAFPSPPPQATVLAEAKAKSSTAVIEAAFFEPAGEEVAEDSGTAKEGGEEETPENDEVTEAEPEEQCEPESTLAVVPKAAGHDGGQPDTLPCGGSLAARCSSSAVFRSACYARVPF